jgi:hypothetical protein
MTWLSIVGVVVEAALREAAERIAPAVVGVLAALAIGGGTCQASAQAYPADMRPTLANPAPPGICHQQGDTFTCPKSAMLTIVAVAVRAEDAAKAADAGRVRAEAFAAQRTQAEIAAREELAGRPHWRTVVTAALAGVAVGAVVATAAR